MGYESDPLSPQLLDVALKVVEVLDQHRVDYAVIGGLAAGYRTHPRATRDLDVLLDIPQIVLPKLLETLEKQGFEFDLTSTIREWIDHHMVVLSYRGVRVDWLKAIIPAYRHVLEKATNETWLGRRIRVASAEGLIVMKLLAGRTQDWLDIENLVAIERDRLDVDWIRGELQALASSDDPGMTRFQELVDRVRKTD